MAQKEKTRWTQVKEFEILQKRIDELMDDKLNLSQELRQKKIEIMSANLQCQEAKLKIERFEYQLEENKKKRQEELFRFNQEVDESSNKLRNVLRERDQLLSQN